MHRRWPEIGQQNWGSLDVCSVNVRNDTYNVTAPPAGMPSWTSITWQSTVIQCSKSSSYNIYTIWAVNIQKKDAVILHSSNPHLAAGTICKSIIKHSRTHQLHIIWSMIDVKQLEFHRITSQNFNLQEVWQIRYTI